VQESDPARELVHLVPLEMAYHVPADVDVLERLLLPEQLLRAVFTQVALAELPEGAGLLGPHGFRDRH